MKRKTAKYLIILLLLMTVAGAFAGCRGNADITSADQLNRRGIKVGVATDTTEFSLVKKYYPKAEIVYFKDDLAAYTSVAQGKVDAYVYNWVSMHTAILNGLKGVRLLDETVGKGNVGAVAISPKTRIPDLKGKLDEFLEESKKDGTIEDIEKRWILENDGKMPDIPKPEDPQLHLVVATTGNNAPFTYYEGTELAGYEVELAKRFASWLGASLEFKIYDYDGIVAAAQAGDVDCIFANLFITPEREKTIQFSEPTYISKIGIMVKDTGNTQEYTSLSDFDGKRIGAATGAIQGPLVEEQIPSAEVSYFNNHADLLNALKQGKIDGYADSDLMIRYQMIYNDDLTYLDEKLADPVDVGVIFAKNDKGDRIRAEFNEYLKKQNADGKLKEKEDLWFGEDESVKKVKDPSGLPAKNGTLTLATYASVPPFTYVSDNQIVGMDIDIVTGFCEEYGYGLEIVDMSFDGLISAVASEKFDFGAGCIAITEERAESVNFSDPMYQGNSVIAYLKVTGGSSKSFFASLKDSFEKTFIRENRWKLFLAGMGTTLLITVMSILAGTLLGFVVFMACRNGNRIANKITRFSVWLIQGMPVVVLLMILYYIVFSNVGIPGAAVSVVAFTLIFASAVYSMLVTGVSAVDIGQTEAAYSLGYTDRRAFYRVVLPQALPLIMPVYKAQITALIKATAVVGYVAVQDLTKMGDIVRSRTYEAFFPLVSVAVMYFVLAAILTRIVEKIEISVDPKQKKKKLSDIPDE